MTAIVGHIENPVISGNCIRSREPLPNNHFGLVLLDDLNEIYLINSNLNSDLSDIDDIKKTGEICISSCNPCDLFKYDTKILVLLIFRFTCPITVKVTRNQLRILQVSILMQKNRAGTMIEYPHRSLVSHLKSDDCVSLSETSQKRFGKNIFYLVAVICIVTAILGNLMVHSYWFETLQ